jgi:hypothetical protein
VPRKRAPTRAEGRKTTLRPAKARTHDGGTGRSTGADCAAAATAHHQRGTKATPPPASGAGARCAPARRGGHGRGGKEGKDMTLHAQKSSLKPLSTDPQRCGPDAAENPLVNERGKNTRPPATAGRGGEGNRTFPARRAGRPESRQTRENVTSEKGQDGRRKTGRALPSPAPRDAQRGRAEGPASPRGALGREGGASGRSAPLGRRAGRRGATGGPEKPKRRRKPRHRACRLRTAS